MSSGKQYCTTALQQDSNKCVVNARPVARDIERRRVEWSCTGGVDRVDILLWIRGPFAFSLAWPWY